MLINICIDTYIYMHINIIYIHIWVLLNQEKSICYVDILKKHIHHTYVCTSISVCVCAQSFIIVAVKPECQEFCIWMYVRLSLSSIDLRKTHTQSCAYLRSHCLESANGCNGVIVLATHQPQLATISPCGHVSRSALALPRRCRSFQAGRDHFFSSAAEGDFGCRFTAARICKGRYGCRRILILTAMWLKQCHKPPHF